MALDDVAALQKAKEEAQRRYEQGARGSARGGELIRLRAEAVAANKAWSDAVHRAAGSPPIPKAKG
jgi:hypothetical protein